MSGGACKIIVDSGWPPDGTVPSEEQIRGIYANPEIANACDDEAPEYYTKVSTLLCETPMTEKTRLWLSKFLDRRFRAGAF